MSNPKCPVLYGWMSVEGIQICVDGVAEAMVAVRPYSAHDSAVENTIRKILRSWTSAFIGSSCLSDQTFSGHSAFANHLFGFSCIVKVNKSSFVLPIPSYLMVMAEGSTIQVASLTTTMNSVT